MSGTENIKIMCPNLSCGKVLAVPTAARGKVVRCRHCGTTIRIPTPATTAPTPDAQGGSDEANAA
jgi:ribosomal protein S27E